MREFKVLAYNVRTSRAMIIMKKFENVAAAWSYCEKRTSKRYLVTIILD